MENKKKFKPLMDREDYTKTIYKDQSQDFWLRLFSDIDKVQSYFLDHPEEKVSAEKIKSILEEESKNGMDKK